MREVSGVLRPFTLPGLYVREGFRVHAVRVQNHDPGPLDHR